MDRERRIKEREEEQANLGRREELLQSAIARLDEDRKALEGEKHRVEVADLRRRHELGDSSRSGRRLHQSHRHFEPPRHYNRRGLHQRR